MKQFRALLLGLFLSDCNACSEQRIDVRERLTNTPPPKLGECTVELWYAALPQPLKYFAVHYWFVVTDPNGLAHRWEVWQDNWKEVFDHMFKGTSLSSEALQEKWEILSRTWGVCQKDCQKIHLFRDLNPKYVHVGGGQSTLHLVWRGETAELLRSVIETGASAYPDAKTYHYWPGPNSNTYPAWVLRQAQVSADLHPMAIGKDFIGSVHPAR